MNLELTWYIVSGIATVVWMMIGILIKVQLADIRITQVKDRAELLASQTLVRAELVAQISKTVTEVAVHSAEDKLKFDNIASVLSRIETRLNEK